MVTQVTWFLFTVSSFSTSDQNWLSTNNYNLLNPLFLYTNFISLILLTHSSLTNSSSVLPLFLLQIVFGYIFPTIVHRILSPNDWGSFLWCHFYPLSPSTHTHLLCLCLSLHDVVTEDGDPARRRHAGLSLLLLSAVFFIQLTFLGNFYYLLNLILHSLLIYQNVKLFQVFSLQVVVESTFKDSCSSQMDQIK